MPHPSVAQEIPTVMVGAAWVSLLAQVPPDLVFGAFGGATIYLLGIKQKPKWQWALLFTISFMCGMMGGPMVSSIVSGALAIIKITAKVPQGLGAMTAAAVTVNALTYLRDNPSFFFRKREPANPYYAAADEPDREGDLP